MIETIDFRRLWLEDSTQYLKKQQQPQASNRDRLEDSDSAKILKNKRICNENDKQTKTPIVCEYIHQQEQSKSKLRTTIATTGCHSPILASLNTISHHAR